MPLAPQGDIESVAGMQPADLTNLVEQIAGTDVLRPEYEQLELAKQSAEEKTSYVFSKKKSIAMEKRQKREQKEEAEKHLQLEKDLVRAADRGKGEVGRRGRRGGGGLGHGDM